ncbi:MAG: tRNA uridine-5-carboxymethylaminomethyl(34) synthesis enzyme MnmG, partial [Oscillospiraceae bacterium]
KYEGYIKKQMAQVAQMRRMEKRELPADLDYTKIRGLRLEAQEKLSRVQPRSVGQASRISGVSPADISVLLIYLQAQGRPQAPGHEGDGNA